MEKKNLNGRDTVNPYKNLISVLTAQDLLKFVFYRASKVALKSESRLDPVKKARFKELERVRIVERELLNKFNQYIKSYPNFNEVPPFYLELTNVVVDGGVDRIKQILASLSKGIPVIKKITASTIKRIKFSNNPREMANIRISYYGRISSFIKKYDGRFEELNEFRRVLRKLPSIDPNIPTVVVAGYPNVGKSSLVKQISTAKPEISYYPFTTKKIIVGKFNKDDINIQIIDSPGLLDRPLEKRNEIEMQAILALRYLAKFIIYLFDPSETCGYSVQDQISLLNSLIKNFAQIPFIIVQNKIDLYDKNYNLDNKIQIDIPLRVFRTCLVENVGIDEIVNFLIEKYEKYRYINL